MASKTYNIHVISKANITSHTTVQYTPSSLPPLPDNHIRAVTRIFGLTSNNLSYAKGGNTLHWWTGFPVPQNLPAPYNDRGKYGIVPVWGFAEILESRIEALTPGQLVWGFWPSYDMLIDLHFRKSDVAGHFIEISEYRSKMMNLYHYYIAMPPTFRITEEKKDMLGWESVFVVLQAGWEINRFIFASNEKDIIHPLGSKEGVIWGKEDADLKDAVVVSMSASGKTARAFQDQLLNARAKGSGPKAFLAVTSRVDEKLLPRSEGGVETRVVTYEESTNKETMEWLRELKAKKAVLIDFASRGDSLERMDETVRRELPDVKIVIIGCGSEAKAHTAEELAAMQKKRAGMSNRVQMNSSGIRDAALEKIGAEQYYKERSAAWKGFVERGNLDNLKLTWGKGIAGKEGFEGGWQQLCDEAVPAGVSIAYEV